jgi:hypothetical protein
MREAASTAAAVADDVGGGDPVREASATIMESQSFHPHFPVSYWIFLCLFHGFPWVRPSVQYGPYAGYADKVEPGYGPYAG